MGVVQACIVNPALTGAALPCFEVNASDGMERSDVILRRPQSEPDLILSPTKEIDGVVGQSLQAFEAPDYFQDAWNARAFVHGAFQKPLARDDRGGRNPTS